jgi:multicomponent Na+:H+ antiporter subunit C
MEIVFAVLIGALFATGVYMMLRRSIVRLIIGLALLGNAANLLIFASGSLVRGKPPIVPEDSLQMNSQFADPLTQALILTSIVISFGVIAYGLVLVHKAYQALQTDDLDALNTTEIN